MEKNLESLNTQGYLFFYASQLMLFVSDIYKHIPIQISNVSGDIDLFKLVGNLSPDSD